MTESNQGPATPGTAARCETCGRIIEERGSRALNAAFVGMRWPLDETFCVRSEGEPRPDCYRLGYERLKAENASLMESLRVAEQLAESRGRMLSDSMALHEKANRDLFATDKKAAAAEKRSTELMGALLELRQQVEDTIVVAQKDVDADDFITAYHFKTGAIHRLLAKARDMIPGAALHGEERRPRKHWPDCALNHGGTDCDMGPDCGAPHPDRAAQGEEK